MNYTHSEQTVKNRTVGQAVKNAGLIYKGSLCLNAVQNKSFDTQITVVELNELVEQIVDDSRFYG